MGETKTRVFIVCENGKASFVQQFNLPIDDRAGFFGTLEIKLQGGRATAVSVPRQSLTMQTISKEDWERIFGPIQDSVQGID